MKKRQIYTGVVERVDFPNKAVVKAQVDPLWDASSAFAGSYRLLIFIQESIHTGRKLGRQKSHTFLGNNVHMTDERIRRLHR